MKKLIFLIPLLAISMCVSCKEETAVTPLTFGTYKEEELLHISISEYNTMVKGNENFLLAIYPNYEDKVPCRCWTTFNTNINRVVKENHYRIYGLYSEDVTKDMLDKGFYNYNNAPTFYIVNRGLIRKRYDYNANNTLYTSYDSLLDEIVRYTYAPRLMIVSEEQLAEKTKGDANVMFFRNSCSDCQVVIPALMVPYLSSLNYKKEVLAFDMDYLYGTEEYKQIKDKYHLSSESSEAFGYLGGVVPTIQAYRDGELVDADVVLNDEISYNSEGDYYYVSKSFFSEQRQQYLHYLENSEYKVLENMRVDPKDVIESQGKYYWNVEIASYYHSSMLEGFMTYYEKN